MNIRKRIHLAIVISLLLAALSGAPRTVSAAPETPQTGGLFIVNIESDTNDPGDLGLSLREALLLARGGTGPKGLNRLMTAPEAINVQGCSFSIPFLDKEKVAIAGGCGEGIADTIRIGLWFPENSILELEKELPPIDDTAPTILDGEQNGIVPVLDLSKNVGIQGLTVASNGNVLKGLMIRGGRCPGNGFCPANYALSLKGSHNEVSNVAIVDMHSQGIEVLGTDNKLDRLRIGVPQSNFAVCPPAVPGINTGLKGDGVHIGDQAARTTLSNSVIGCTDDGVYVGGATDTTIGPNNRIGTASALASTFFGNAGAGIHLGPNTQAASVISNTVAHNADSGIVLFNATNNVVSANLVHRNGEDGIVLVDAANNNQIGGPAAGNAFGGNKIVLNQQNGIHLIGVYASPTGNTLVGNWVGTANAASASGNKGSGVVLAGAVDTKLGLPAPSAPNVIVSNEGSGIWLLDGAHDNDITNNLVGTNGFTALGNLKNGIALSGGAHHNLVGGLANGTSNLIGANGEAGVLIKDETTVSNMLLRNRIYANGLDGVRLMQFAANNMIGSTGIAGVAYNQLFSNGRNGVRMDSGAHHNSVGSNRIYNNNGAGVLFWDVATRHNTITQTRIYNNKGGMGDGIADGNGADFNVWSRISTYGNIGLGIDRTASDGTNNVTSSFPTITNISDANGAVTISGKGTGSSAGKSVLVEAYRVDPDASGYGEGQLFVGSAPTTAGGDFAVTFNGVGGCFTVFQTVTNGTNQYSSEFSAYVCAGLLQTIDFASLPDMTADVQPFVVNPVASSGLPVTVAAEGACTIAQKTVSIVGAGTCILTAQQPGDALYAPAPDKVVEFEVWKKSQSILWGADGSAQSQVATAAPIGLNATATSGLPVVFAAQGVCTVDGSTVTITGGPGECSLIAQQPGNAEYYAAPEIERSFTVTKADQAIEFAPIADKKLGNAPFPIAASASSGLPVQIESITPQVCTIAGGQVSLVAVGPCTLQAIQAGSNVFNPATPVQRTFAVQEVDQGAQTLYLPLVVR